MFVGGGVCVCREQWVMLGGTEWGCAEGVVGSSLRNSMGVERREGEAVLWLTWY